MTEQPAWLKRYGIEPVRLTLDMGPAELGNHLLQGYYAVMTEVERLDRELETMRKEMSPKDNGK